MLRIAGQEERVEEWLRPIPFPRHRIEPSTDPSAGALDPIAMVEQALDLVQNDLDDMNRLLGEPLPFPSECSNDDGPSAA